MQARNASNVKIIDVSHHQGNIDWSQVKNTGVRGVFIKATEGQTGIDPAFARNAAEAAKCEFPCGYYHYAHPENNEAAEEAAKFAAAVKGYSPVFPHALDVEGDAAKLGKDKLSAWCATWLREVERLTGHPAMVYTGASFALSYLGGELGEWPLWIAEYGTDKPLDNTTWSRWAVFQYSSSGTVSGIDGSVDMNEMEAAFFEQYTVSASKTAEAAPALSREDAQKIIDLLSADWKQTTDQEARTEIHRLANEVRKAAGMPVT